MNIAQIEHFKRMRFPKQQRGASLLEGLAYLGIAAVIILGAIGLLTSALGGAQGNSVVQDLTAIRTGTAKLFMGQGYGLTSLNTTLVAARVFPSTMAQAANGTVTNNWGGSVTVTGATSTFTVRYDSVPQDVCINVLRGTSGWSQIVIGSAAPIVTFPVSPTTATSSCPAGSSTMTFTAG